MVTVETSSSLSVPGSDVNGDGGVDIWWRNSSGGQNIAWFMGDTTPIGTKDLFTLPTDWTLAGVGDFNKDGQSDVLWQSSSSGQVYAWYLNQEGNVIGDKLIVTMPLDWRIASTGDFNRDQKTDILWTNKNSGALYVWYMDGSTVAGDNFIITMPTDWQVSATGDFDNNGSDDLVWSNANAGMTYIWFMNGITPIGDKLVGILPNSWTVRGTGDFNSDGQTDVLWWNNLSGQVYTWYMNGGTPIGDKFIATIDPSWRPLSADRGGLADLTLQNALAPASVANGGTVNLSATVINQGSKTAPGSTVKYYLSNDGSLDQGDLLLGETTLTPMRSGQSRQAEFSFTYNTATMGTGAKNILFVADANNTVAERNEANNVVGKALNITAVTPPTDVDLLIQSPTAPGTVVEGEQLTITATVRNQGTTAAAASTLSIYISDDQTLNTQTDNLATTLRINALAPGGSSLASTPFVYDPAWGTGTKYVYIVADAQSEVGETNEANNTAVLTLVVNPASRVDLIVQSPSVPGALTVAQPVTVSATVVNQGTTKAPASTLSVYISDDQVFDVQSDVLASSINIAALEAGSSSLAALTFTYSSAWGIGPKYLYFVADAPGTVAETDETNNIAGLAITVNPSIDSDLVVQGAALSSTSILPNTSLNLTARVQNTGTGPAGSSTLRFYLSNDATFNPSINQFLGSKTIGGIDPNSSSDLQTFTFDYSAAFGTGTKYILFVADALNSVSEVNELNNVTALELLVNEPAPPGKDLIVNSFSASTSSIVTGDTVSVNATVRNQGADTSGASSLGYYISNDAVFDASDILIGTSAITSLNTLTTSSAQNLEFVYQASYGTGSKYILFVADNGNIVAESQEGNNVSALAIEVLPKIVLPDLLPTNLALVNTSIPLENGNIEFSYQLENQGGALGSGPFTLSYYLSNDDIFDDNDIFIISDPVSPNEIPEGESLSKGLFNPYNPTWGSGTRYLLVRVDAGNTVPESNEANNLGAIRFTVTNEEPV